MRFFQLRPSPELLASPLALPRALATPQAQDQDMLREAPAQREVCNRSLSKYRPRGYTGIGSHALKVWE